MSTELQREEITPEKDELIWKRLSFLFGKLGEQAQRISELEKRVEALDEKLSPESAKGWPYK